MDEAKWYVIATMSGYENKVATNLEKIVENRHLQEWIHEVRIPTETVVEVKDNQRKEVERKWREENPELSAKLDLFLSGKTPEIDYSKIEIAPGSATRNATATILGAFAEQIEKVEHYRPEDAFTGAVKGLYVFGAKVVRPEEIYVIKTAI